MCIRDRFWMTVISGNLEVRWDVFEESMLIYLETKLELDKEVIARVNWTRFLSMLKDKISSNVSDPNVIREIPLCPMHKEVKSYKGTIVSIDRWIEFVETKGISKTLLDALEDYTAYLEMEKQTLLTVAGPSMSQGFGLQSQGSLQGTGLLPSSRGNDAEMLPSQYQGSSVSPSFKNELVKQNATSLQAAFKRRNEESGLYRYADGSWYKGEWYNGRRHGKGKLSLSSGDVYEGELYEGKRHGNGVMYLREPMIGVVYTGEWKDDMRHGFGSVEWPDKALFQGKWETGLQVYGTFVWPDIGEYTGFWSGPEMEGEGTYKAKSGEILIGQWKRSRLNGKAERKLPNGDVYTGEWVDGKLEGKGHAEQEDGVYDGYYLNNKEHGKGIKIYKDGSSYDGEWKDGYAQGRGTFKSFDGSVYIGEFERGLKQGRGTKKFPEGDRYEGEWREDVMWGYGTMIYAPTDPMSKKNVQYTGQWKFGVFHGQGLIVYENGSFYEGNWENGLRHGEGKEVIVVKEKTDEREALVDTYIGQFENDQPHGYGIMNRHDGSCYKGQWYKGKRQGKGELKTETGRVYIGLFNEDEVVGPNMERIYNETAKKNRVGYKAIKNE
eukprot:TRINITY_DN11255_c0_g1_i5.p1 TRINITY_DN11255_c0_g1~~TRINITY_DN11255_c0_g1_i5.p1  ORF type:complete len:621 (-),score=70.11 TRINITY_DN11255_c0_g1_i5:256-2076(-)